MTDPVEALAAALERIRLASENEASRPYSEDGHVIGPNGLTVADWRAVNRVFVDLPRGIDVVPTDPCEGCGAADCSALWASQRKCCPDCTHDKDSPEFDVVPTGDAGLDAELRREVVRIVGNGEWWAREYAFRVLSPLAARLSSSDTEPLESDPIETFSHPFRAPVVIDGHEYRHTSDCEWPSSSDTERQKRTIEAALGRRIWPSSDTGGRG